MTLREAALVLGRCCRLFLHPAGERRSSAARHLTVELTTSSAAACASRALATVRALATGGRIGPRLQLLDLLDIGALRLPQRVVVGQRRRVRMRVRG